MFKIDARESSAIIARMLDNLLTHAPTRGREGADLRSACGTVKTHAETLLYNDVMGEPLANCFDLAREAGIKIPHLARVRQLLYEEEPVTLGAVMVVNAGVEFCLATEARILADLSFTSRQDAEAMKTQMNSAFTAAEEVAADNMAQATYRALVELHAAVSFYLIETARPLPRMIGYRFAQQLPSLVMSYKLYDTAARGDELRNENKVIHPAFMPRIGRALSA